MKRHPVFAAARRGLLFAFLFSLFGMPAIGGELLMGTLIGEPRRVTVAEGDTLPALARAHDVGYVALRAANPDVDVWLPRAGRELELPTVHIAPHGGDNRAIVNRPEMRVYIYEPDGSSWAAPISLGRQGYQTPLGRLPIGQKRLNPAWHPTAAHRAENPDLPAVVPAGPDNPLGAHALRLGMTEYLLHGTNRPGSIGRQVSRGCIRLSPHAIERLFEAASLGDHVSIIDAPAKIALKDGVLYLEIAPSADQIAAYDQNRPIPDDPYTGIEDSLRRLTGDIVRYIDWDLVLTVARERRGVPMAITPPEVMSDSAERSISAWSD